MLLLIATFFRPHLSHHVSPCCSWIVVLRGELLHWSCSGRYFPVGAARHGQAGIEDLRRSHWAVLTLSFFSMSSTCVSGERSKFLIGSSAALGARGVSCFVVSCPSVPGSAPADPPHTHHKPCDCNWGGCGQSGSSEHAQSAKAGSWATAWLMLRGLKRKGIELKYNSDTWRFLICCCA